MAKPRIKLTEKDRKYIKKLAGYGMNNKDIASVVGVSESTVKRQCQAELSIGKSKWKGDLQKTASYVAIKQKNVTMLIFLLKTRCGYRERDRERSNIIDVKNATTEELQAYVKANNTNTSRAGAKRKN